MNNAPLKLLFAGPTGAGKTTAIAAISDFPPVSTDVAATDEVASMKEATTVAMDYGEITLAEGQKVFLYGTPGQQRFDFMWKICAEVIEGVSEGLGCAVIDLESGLLVGISHVTSALPEALLDTMAASVAEVLRGRAVSIVEEMFAQFNGGKPKRLVESLQLTTDKAHIFTAVIPDKPGYVVALVVGKKATLGSGWASIRSAMSRIQPLCP
jgi:DNA polymerase III delta prime subunit